MGDMRNVVAVHSGQAGHAACTRIKAAESRNVLTPASLTPQTMDRTVDMRNVMAVLNGEEQQLPQKHEAVGRCNAPGCLAFTCTADQGLYGRYAQRCGGAQWGGGARRDSALLSGGAHRRLRRPRRLPPAHRLGAPPYTNCSLQSHFRKGEVLQAGRVNITCCAGYRLGAASMNRRHKCHVEFREPVTGGMHQLVRPRC